MAKRKQTEETPPVYLLSLDQIIADLREANLPEWADRLTEMRREIPVAVANARMIVERRSELIEQAELNLAEANRQVTQKMQEMEANLASFMMKDAMVLAAEKMAASIIDKAETQAAEIVANAEAGQLTSGTIYDPGGG